MSSGDFQFYMLNINLSGDLAYDIPCALEIALTPSTRTSTLWWFLQRLQFVAEVCVRVQGVLHKYWPVPRGTFPPRGNRPQGLVVLGVARSAATFLGIALVILRST